MLAEGEGNMGTQSETKRLSVSEDGTMVVSDCGKTWQVPEGHKAKWYMTKVCEMLVDAGYAVIMDAEALGGDQ